jgi:light-regulated signal transduction histidine kinase (bacteriophytochrome)
MTSTIKGLLDYARLGTEKQKYEPVNMDQVLERAIYHLEISIDQNNVQINKINLPVVAGSEIQLVQLMQNLIGNAIKYRSQKTPIIDIGVQQKGAFYEFSVRDNGIGIDSRQASRVF